MFGKLISAIVLVCGLMLSCTLPASAGSATSKISSSAESYYKYEVWYYHNHRWHSAYCGRSYSHAEHVYNEYYDEGYDVYIETIDE